MNQSFSTLIVIKPDDFDRQKRNYKRLVNNLQTDNIIFVSSEPIKELIANAALGSSIGFVDESSLIPFDTVHKVMEKHLAEILQGESCPRGATGWYYQQFLKMQYARVCKDEFYMVWDGDTIPCRPINMFSDAGAPYLDLKYEYHEAYFETLETLLPGMRKCIKKSFISEHMLINTKLMCQLLDKIESNSLIEGDTFWEKIIHAIPPRRIVDSAFSEFETYGTFVCFTNPGLYKLREWHSFRLGAEFFNPNEITDRDYEWLGKDFHAISFEKNQEVREDHNNLFNNPEYQSKLSARKMLEIAQEEFNGGYIEIWDDNADSALLMDPLSSSNSKKSPIFQPEDEMYEKMGDILSLTNINQAYLCYENAAFLSSGSELIKRCEDKIARLKDSGRLSVKKASIAIVSYNKKELLQQCIWSIEEHCAPGSFEIVVVDNASTDGVAKWLSTQSEKMTVLLSDENLGFAGGCNACIKYSMLNVSKSKIVNFNLKNATSFNGESGMYILYSIARINSILKNNDIELSDKLVFENDIENKIIKELSNFPNVVDELLNSHEPAHLTKYIFYLTQCFSKFYENVNISNEKDIDLKSSRIRLLRSIKIVLEKSLSILGIDTIDYL